MKKQILLFLFAIAMNGFTFAQLGTAMVTYTDGDIETDKDFTWYNGSQFSDCPGQLTVTIPVGATILQTDVTYDMTSDASPGSNIAKQRSHFRCVSPGGLSEPSMTTGPYIYEPGTHTYTRTGLDLANGVMGGGDILFELHAGATFYKDYCSTDSVKVDNNTWTVSITYIPAGYPEQALNPDPEDGGLYIGLDDDLAWDFGANTDSYDVYFGTDNPPTTKLVDNETAGASGTFDPGTMLETTTYYWQIVSRNANGYTSGPVWSFTTVCGAFQTPFTEDFEGVTTPELPYCWQSIFSSSATYASLETSSYGGHLGPQCVLLNAADDPDGTLIFITPMVDVGEGSLADKMVHFYAKGESFPNFSVGTMSDPTDEATFTPYETFFLWNDYQEYDIYLNDYAGTDTYIAFRLEPTSSYQAGYIDDITVQDMPTCLRPTDLSADNLTITSATLSWTDPNGASAWNIEWGEAGFIPTGTPTISGVTNPYELTVLESATEYDFYVQADCGGGDVSAWSSVGTFLTPCDFYEVPFSEDFEGLEYLEMPVCWSSIILCGDTWVMNGTMDGTFQMENGWDVNSTLMLISPPVLDLTPNRIKFHAKSNMEGYDLIIGTMSNPAVQSTFEEISTVTLTTEYVEYDVWLNGYTGTNNYFAIKHSNGAEYLSIQIDDVSIEALPTCLPPVDVYVNDITTTTANLYWTETASATDWEIEIGELGFEPGTGTFLNQYSYNNTELSNLVYELPGLTAAVVYDVYVRTDCGDEDYSPWTGPVTFMTSFETFSLPVTEDFESGMGITGNSYMNTVDWVMNTEVQHSGLNSVHNPYTEDNDNVLFMLGTFDLTSKSDVMLSFWHIAKTANSDVCYIEISTDGGLNYAQLPESTYAGAGNYSLIYWNGEGPHFNESSYTAWGTGSEIPDNTWWRKEYFNLSDYNAFDEVVIRFRLVSDAWTTKAGWYIDDIAVEALGAPVLNIDPLTIEEEVSGGMPLVNVDLNMGNSGDFPANYTATVVYDEMDLLNENFNSGIPGEWTIISNGTSEVTWAGTTEIFGRSFDGTPFAWADGNQSWGPAELTMDDDLISPAVDASDYADGSLLLEFDMAFNASWQDGDTAKVYVFDGAEWVIIYESWNSDGDIYQGGTHKVIDVTAYANDNFQVKFNYIEGPLQNGRYFALDNVRLRASMSVLDWLTVDGAASTNGVSMPGAGSVVAVEMDATGFALGTYNAEIEVTSNDPTNPSTMVPVTMIVGCPNPWGYLVTGSVHTINVPASSNPNVNGTSLVEGDWVGVFFTDDEGNHVCGGAGQIDATGGAVVTAYGDDPTTEEKDGFDVGEKLIWKMYVCNDVMDYSAGATYDETKPNQGFFADFGLSSLTSLEFMVCQYYSFTAGWNAVSSYITPMDANVETMFAPIVDDVVILRNLTDTYWPGEGINTIGDWDNASGYALKMYADAEFEICGDDFAGTELSLETGWSYIPTLSQCSANVMDMFGDNLDDIVIIQDLIGTQIFWPAQEIYSLETLEPGNAYKIKVINPFTATFPECDGKATIPAFSQVNSIQTIWGDVNMTPSTEAVAFMASATVDFMEGDVIGVFGQNNKVYGYMAVTGAGIAQAITLFGDDATTISQDGFEEGETVSYKLYRAETGETYDLNVEYDYSMENVSGNFHTGSFAAIRGVTMGITGVGTVNGGSIDMYPNPATDMVYISLNGDYNEATVVIYDTEGRTVINQVFNGQAELNVSSLEAGVYFVKINTETMNEIRKLVIK